MKRLFLSRWFWVVILLAIIPVGVVLSLRQHELNDMLVALDKLASVEVSERWTRPEMQRIRQLGIRAVPSLRRVLREKDRPTTRFLLWVKENGRVTFLSQAPHQAGHRQQHRSQ